MEDKKGEVTGLLLAWRDGDESALGQLMPLMLAELRRIAKGFMDGERSDHTLQPTALINELYVKLVDVRRVTWRNRAHFLGTAATMMRRILVDYARQHHAGKRGDGIKPLPIDELFDHAEIRPSELIQLDDALDDLYRIDERRGRAIEMSYFVGLTYQEIGEVLNVSPGTVKLDLQVARAWLLDYMESKDDDKESKDDDKESKDDDETG